VSLFHLLLQLHQQYFDVLVRVLVMLLLAGMKGIAWPGNTDQLEIPALAIHQELI
jgi:hypothetical protein